MDLAISARPSAFGRFGRFGGQYVPETLMPALSELEQAAKQAWEDKAFKDELNNLLHSYVGRATPLYEAKRLSEYYRRKDGGPRIWLKREDLEDKDNTEQGVLTWEIAPKERENGVIIKALTQVQAPNYVTYEFKSHLKSNGDGKLGKNEKQRGEERQQHVAGLVHAAYCGCVDAKESFMSRVYVESKMSAKELGARGLKPEKIEAVSYTHLTLPTKA